MESDATSQLESPAYPPQGPSLADGAEAVVALSDALRRMQAAIAEAVDLAGRCSGPG